MKLTIPVCNSLTRFFVVRKLVRDYHVAGRSVRLQSMEHILPQMIERRQCGNDLSHRGCRSLLVRAPDRRPYRV